MEAWWEREGRLRVLLKSDPESCDASINYLVAAGQPGGDFGGILMCSLLHALVDRNDDGRLVKYLSQVAVEKDGPDSYYLEYALVEPNSGRSVTGLLVLTDAYERAAKPYVKASLASSIRRAFRSEIDPSTSNDEACAIARRIITDQHAHLKVNQEWRFAYVRDWFNVTNYQPPPLLIPKDGPDAVKGIIE